MLKLLTTAAAGALFAASFAMAGPDVGATGGVNAGGTVGGTVGTPATGTTGISGNVNAGTSAGGNVNTGTSAAGNAGAGVSAGGNVNPDIGADASGAANTGSETSANVPGKPQANLGCTQSAMASAGSAGRFHAMITNNGQAAIAAHKTISYTLSDGTTGQITLKNALPPGKSIETTESAAAGFSCSATIQ